MPTSSPTAAAISQNTIITLLNYCNRLLICSYSSSLQLLIHILQAATTVTVVKSKSGYVTHGQ